MKITLEEIARKANVSKATVSRVLNNRSEGVGKETRERVAAILENSGYLKSAPTEHGTHTRTIGLILPDITNPFFAELVKSVGDCTSENGYNVIFGNSNFSQEKEEMYISTFISKRVDGILLISTLNECGRNHKLLERYHVPCVLLDRMLPMPFSAGVFADNEYAIYNACDLLIKHGTRNIAFIAGPQDISTAIERVEGYKTALRQHGIPLDKKLIKFGDYTVESGYNTVMELEREGAQYHGIIASNDMMAIGAIQALHELSYTIPDDVEVIGFDNISYSLLCEPKLSTIQQPTIEMGRLGTMLLLDAINGKPIEKRVIRLQPKMILRKSTK